jgi:hypothetical protein
MPAQYVKPYAKTNKSDYIDASALPIFGCWMGANTPTDEILLGDGDSLFAWKLYVEFVRSAKVVAYVRPCRSVPHAELPKATFVNASQSARAWIRRAVFLKVRRRLPSPDPL